MHPVLICLLAAATALILPLNYGACQGETIPDRININNMEKYYGAVSFNHKGHISTLKDCAVCHHHTTGTMINNPICKQCHSNSNAEKNVACRACHKLEPFSAEALRDQAAAKRTFHIDKPGLKGAYHQSCLGCHLKMKGPTGCKDCHSRNDDGDALYRSGKYAPPKKTAGSGHGKH